MAAYPVQPTFVAVREIHFVSNRPPKSEDRIDQNQVKIGQRVSAFDEITKRVQITLVAEYGFEPEQQGPKTPFSVRVVMTGEFAIADSFPRDKIALWANKNAAFAIFPYLREKLHSVTIQGGYPPILLPLLQIPTLKVELVKETEGLLEAAR